MQLTNKAIRNSWIVYSISIYDANKWTIIYIGAARPSDILRLSEPMDNSEFALLSVMPYVFNFENMGEYATEKEASDAARIAIETHKPHCNTMGVAKNRKRGSRVRCLTDGMEFENANQCAAFYGIASSAMSNHLNGKPYYNSVGGRTFIRI